jgi:ATP-binding protein involved in chromosome partitioning
MSLTPEHILKALGTVEEPDLKRDLVSLNMIRDIEIEGTKVAFTVMLTTPACPLKEKIRQDCENALETHVAKPLGLALEVEVRMAAEVTTSATTGLPNVKNIIAVGSGKGGVGKSTVTANLAAALARTGASVGIIDADISGPSIPIMFGVEEERPDIAEIDGRQMIIPIRKYGIKIISMGFLASAETPIAWRGPMASKALRQFLTETEWGELDYLLIDLPPGTSDIHLTLVQAVPVTGAVIVTTPQKVAVADALKAVGMFKQDPVNVPLLGIVENMAYFTPAELPENRYYIFGQGGGQVLSQQHQIPFLGEVPLVQSIREGGDEGEPAIFQADPLIRKAFEEAAQKLAQQVAIRNATQDKTKPVSIVR